MQELLNNKEISCSINNQINFVYLYKTISAAQ